MESKIISCYTKFVKLAHFFLPHPETHKKAHLLSPWALIIYILLFIFLQTSLDVANNFHPGVLGISSNIDAQTVISLTNSERQKLGLPLLRENQELDKAATAKAQNMFSENYWAHYAPSGKTPWDFITGSGYRFSYAGENLARNFYSSPDVVSAWMASPSHKANIVNSHYQDIGLAVVEGTLQGQKTTLVVQEFGTPVEALAAAPEVASEKTTPQISTSGQTLAAAPSDVLIDPFQLTKGFGLSLVFLLMILITVDLYVLRRRAVFAISSRHLPHLTMMGLTAGALIMMHPGGIL